MALGLTSEFIDLVLFGTVLLWLLYYWATSVHDYWQQRGVPYVKPLPFFGDFILSALSIKSSLDDQLQNYWSHPEEPFVGRFIFRTPVLVIRDPELINTVLIKDFTHFYNRGIKADEKLDPLSQHLVNLRDQKWRSLRNKLSPVFSSGKLKTMHCQLIECSEVLVQALKKNFVRGEFDVREVMASFTTDVIGRCAFGLQMNAIHDPNSEFREMGRAIFKPAIRNRLRSIMRLMYPGLLKKLGWKAMSPRLEEFFIGVIREAILNREASKLQVPDFLQLLINLRREQEGKPSDPDIEFNEALIASNAFIFFVAGFETTASTLSYCLFELAQNPEIQDRVRREVDAVLAKHGGTPTFEAVQEMEYVDQVIYETLRKYPPVTSVPREVTQPYKVPNTDLVLPKGMFVNIPVYSLLHDPKYYPDPDRFDPDRFSEENKENIVKGTYLPFGDGPRICIGKRFAQMEMKVAISMLIKEFTFTTSRRTQLPLKYNKQTLFLVPVGSLWLNLQSRN